MAKQFRYKHISTKIEDRVPQVLFEGEIAINRFAGKEKLLTKNSINEVVSFSSDNVIEEMINDKLGTGFTLSSVTEVIEENERVISAALNDLEENKADISAVTESIEGATSGKTDTSAFTAHTSDATIHHTHDNKSALDAITGNVGTMAYENISSYSSATEVNTALANIESKSVVSAVTVNSDLSNVTCPTSITGASKSGAQAVVIYVNGGTTTDYTVTVSTSYKTPDGNQISVTCAKNGYCEINYLNIDGIIYARGA